MDNELVDKLEGATLEPYLLLSETADPEWFRQLMKDEGVEVVLEWRYYYAYKDAIRIIDFVETSGIYDAWVVLLPKAAQTTADKIREKYPKILGDFAEAEERFLRGLPPNLLVQALASERMKGCSLVLAKQILKEQQIEFSEEEIRNFKQKLRTQNAKQNSKIGLTKVFIWVFLVVVILVYLWLVGFFRF